MIDGPLRQIMFVLPATCGMLLLSGFAFCEDNYEPNDTRAAAYDLSLHERKWLSTVDGYGEQLDSDWYRIMANTAAKRFIIECDFTHPDGNIDISLYDNSGRRLASSVSRTNNEHIDYVVPAEGFYFIRVFGDGAGNTYNLWWDDLFPLDEDPYEKVFVGPSYKDNDTSDTAWHAGKEWERRWLSEMRGPATAGDDDWYEIDVSDFGPLDFLRVVALCEFDNSEGNINLRLYDAAGTLLYGSGGSVDNEHIDYTVPAGGKYYIRVFGGTEGQTYDLWWDDTEESADDAYEYPSGTAQNDTWQWAWYPGFDGSYHNWRATPLRRMLGIGRQMDNDWFAIDTTSERIVIAAIFSDSGGNIDVSLHNSIGTQLALSQTSDDNEYIDFQLSGGGRHYIRVYGAGTGNSYNLWWADMPGTAEDAYEQNDTIGAANDVTKYRDGRWLTELDGIGILKDDDWYEVYVGGLPGKQRVLAECKFIDFNGNIDLELRDRLGNVVAASRTTTDDERIDFTVPEIGIYHLRVFGDNAGNIYDLYWDNAWDDSYEINNDRAHATDLTTHEKRWLSEKSGYGVHMNDDYYKIEVSPTTAANDYRRVAVDLRFSHADGDLNMVLLNDSGSTLGTPAESTTDNEYLALRVPSDGIYYIRVYSDSSTQATYDLWWDDMPMRRTFTFPSNPQGWTWFDAAPAFVAPAHSYDSVGRTLVMTESPGDRIVFGSWESPKNPALGVAPIYGHAYRARFSVRSSVDGAACPGIRFRGITAHVIEDPPGVWNPDFANQDFNATTEMMISTLDFFHVAGREPGTAGTTYTLLLYPEQVPTLQDRDMVNYFTCDLLDLDALVDSDAGTISIEKVVVDTLVAPYYWLGDRVAELSFNDMPGANDLSGWTPHIQPLDPVHFVDNGIAAVSRAEDLAITVAPGSQWFAATLTSPRIPLTSGKMYMARFRVTSTETGAGPFGPTVRAGFYSERLVFSVDRQLPGGSTNARLGPMSKLFPVLMVAPSPVSAGQTEPMGLRFMSWLPDNNTGWPFFKDVNGTVTCDQIKTSEFLPFF